MFAAFTALLMFVFAITGVALGRGLVDRNAPPIQRYSAADGERDRADTDVFEAVRDDRSEEPATVSAGETATAGETAPTKVEVNDLATEKLVQRPLRP